MTARHGILALILLLFPALCSNSVLFKPTMYTYTQASIYFCMDAITFVFIKTVIIVSNLKKDTFGVKPIGLFNFRPLGGGGGGLLLAGSWVLWTATVVKMTDNSRLEMTKGQPPRKAIFSLTTDFLLQLANFGI